MSEENHRIWALHLHCRSDQINSTISITQILDKARPIKLYTTCCWL